MKTKNFSTVIAITMMVCTSLFTTSCGNFQKSIEERNAKQTENAKDYTIKINEALNSNNYAEAHSVLDLVMVEISSLDPNKYEDNPWGGGAYVERSLREKYENLYDHLFDKVLKAEFNFLTSLDDKTAEIIALEALGKVDFGECYPSETTSSDINGKANVKYRARIDNFNNFCLSEINKALLEGKLQKAQRIQLVLKDNFEIIGKDTFYDIWGFTQTSKNEAQKLINEYKKTHKIKQ